MNDRLMTITQVTMWLGVSRGSIFRWIRRDNYPLNTARRPCGGRRGFYHVVSRRDVIEFLVRHYPTDTCPESRAASDKINRIVEAYYRRDTG